MIDAWRIGAAILESVDMSEFSDLHGDDEDLISAIDATAHEMRKFADEIEHDQQTALDQMKTFYAKKFNSSVL